MSDNNTAIAKFTKDLQGQSRAISSMLPTGMDEKRFLRTVVNTINTHPQSERLLSADRQSLFNSCQKAAGDGLLLDGREATLIVFKDNKKKIDKVNYIPMVQGLVKLARNSGEISSIISEIVYSNDKFTYRPGIDSHPNHDPDWFGDRGQPIGCYAVITLTDGEKVTTVMPQKRIMEIAGTGHNAIQYTPGKGVNFVEWWRKTVIKNALKYCPKSTYLESAVQHESCDTGADPVVTIDAEVDVEQARDDIKIKIAQATSKNQLIGMQESITQLPVSVQEELISCWNEKAMELRQNEETSQALSEPQGQHMVNPETGEIVDDIA